MISTDDIAGFAADVEYDRLPGDVREATKRRLLDAVAVGLYNRTSTPADTVRRGLTPDETTATRESRLWGSAVTASAPRAAMANTVAVAAGNGPTVLSPTPAPVAGSIAAVVAASDAYRATGEATIAGLAAALELHGEFAWNAPLDGLHPATHTAVAAAVGAGRTIGLSESALYDAIGLAARRVSLSSGPLSDPVPTGTAALNGLYACLLADGGVTAPDGLAGSGGWHDRLGPFDLDLDPGCERVRDAAVLPYDAGPHEQTAIGAAVALATGTPIDPAEIDTVTVATSGPAVDAIAPGRIAAALIDRELTTDPGIRADLEPVAESVSVVDDALAGRGSTGAFPARVTVESRDGTVSETTHEAFDGHPSTPASWGTVEEKFHGLAAGTYDRTRREKIIDTARSFEAESATELARLLR